MKRVNLIKGYVIDIDSSSITLKSNIKESTKKGKVVETSNIHGYFTNYDSMFKKLHTLLTLENLKESNDMIDLKNAITDAVLELRCITKNLDILK